jgi:hypothetical protein
VEKPAGFGWFNSVLWERISWNKLKQAETWLAEQGLSLESQASKCCPDRSTEYKFPPVVVFRCRCQGKKVKDMFTWAYQSKSVSYKTVFFSHNKSASAKKKQPAEHSLKETQALHPNHWTIRVYDDIFDMATGTFPDREPEPEYIIICGLVHLSYNLYFSAYFFSPNSIFLSQQISKQYFQSWLFSETNGLCDCDNVNYSTLFMPCPCGHAPGNSVGVWWSFRTELAAIIFGDAGQGHRERV